MLYSYFERRHRLSHKVQVRYSRTLRLLTWVRTVYMFISAVMLGFALVKGEHFLAVAALTFLAASFALRQVSRRLEMEDDSALGKKS